MPSMWKVGCWSDSLPLLWSLLIVTRYCLHLFRSSLTSQTTVLLVSLILFTGQQAKWELLRDDPQVISCHCYPVVFKIEEVDYGEKRAHQVTNNAGFQSRDGRFRYIHQDFPRDTYSSHSDILLALPVGMAVKCSFSQKFNFETVVMKALKCQGSR